MIHILTTGDMEKCRIDAWVNLPSLLVFAGACQSKSQARRLIKQGAVEIDDVVEDVPGNTAIRNGAILKVGRNFWRRLCV